MPSATIVPELVVVHPLVLLSVVDHYKRVSPDAGKRVVGVLLGQWEGRSVNVTNCYAVPFEENEQDPTVWFLDHNYHESMSELFKKVTAKERPVGWYHTGPKLRPSDLTINELFRKYTSSPVLVVVDPVSKDVGLPINSYIAIEEIHDDGSATTRTFAHVNSSIEAEEAEEIGVEHLLRDVKDEVVGSLASQINTKLASLRALESHLAGVESYLGRVVAGELPTNHQIMYALQEMFNCLPDVHGPVAVQAMTVKSNDQLMMVFVGSLIRSLLALHELINNKLDQAQSQQVVPGAETKTKEAEAAAAAAAAAVPSTETPAAARDDDKMEQ